MLVLRAQFWLRQNDMILQHDFSDREKPMKYFDLVASAGAIASSTLKALGYKF